MKMAYNHPFTSKANYPRLLVFHTSQTEQLQQEQGKRLEWAIPSLCKEKAILDT